MSAELFRNNTSFPLQLKEALQQALAASSADDDPLSAFLKYYQLLVRVYFRWMLGRRVLTAGGVAQKGLVINHVMGAGKSVLAAALAMEVKTRVVVLLLKSLQPNFDKNVELVMTRAGRSPAEARREIDARFRYVSFNASNMLAQLWRSTQTAPGGPMSAADAARAAVDPAAAELAVDAVDAADNAAADSGIGRLLTSAGSLADTLVIVDEFHLLLRAITNGSRNGRDFYTAVMATPSCRLVGLTGTIIAHDSFELAVCYNLMAGEPLFPEDWSEFRRALCGPHGELRPEVRGHFQNRIMGLTSRIRPTDLELNAAPHKDGQAPNPPTSSSAPNPPREDGQAAHSAATATTTPTLRPDEIVTVEMTDYQTGLYLRAREIEKRERSFAAGGNVARLSKPKSASPGTYRQRSRQLGNFAPPNKYFEALLAASKHAKAHNKKTARPPIDLMAPDDVVSPKFDALLERLRLPGTHIVYSQYVDVGGLQALAMYLRARGWQPFVAEAATAAPSAAAPSATAVAAVVAEDPSVEAELVDPHVPHNPPAADPGVETTQFRAELEHAERDEPAGTTADPLEPIEAVPPTGRPVDADRPDATAQGAAEPPAQGAAEPPAEPPADADRPDATVQGAAAPPVQGAAAPPLYALYTGEVPPEAREAAVRTFNAPDNVDGGRLKLLMISAAGALGVDTKNCRYVHMLETVWVKERELQVKYRAVRLNSHADLPPDQRFVQTYIYMARPRGAPPTALGLAVQRHAKPAETVVDALDTPADVDPEIWGSTDLELYEHAEANYAAVETWISAVDETAIECAVLAEMGAAPRACRMCAPTNEPLYAASLAKSLASADPCMPYAKRELDDVRTVTIDDVEVAYDYGTLKNGRRGGLRGYVFDKGLGAHRRLAEGQPLFKKLTAAVSAATADKQTPAADKQTPPADKQTPPAPGANKN